MTWSGGTEARTRNEKRSKFMPMIDVTTASGVFAPAAKRELTARLTAALMKWEKAPDIALFRDNTAAFVHELPVEAIATAAGAHTGIRVRIETPAGALDRESKLGVVAEMTRIVAEVAGDPSQAQRTWVLCAEAPDGGWGIAGYAYTRADIGEAVRRELAQIDLHASSE